MRAFTLLLSAFALIASVTTTLPTEAAIISSKTIAGRLAKKNGKGLYAIEQEVQFRTTTEPITLRERWIVENGEDMRLIVTGPKSTADSIRFDAVYRGGKRTAPDFRGGLRTSALPSEFLESYLYARSGRGFLDSLVRSGVVPSSFLRERQRFVGKDNRYQKEPLVWLGRTGGVVNYVFGEPTPVDAKKSNPGVWIEQDAFSIRRLRFPTESEITLDRFSTYPNGFRLARERTITWEGNSATIRVLSVKPINAQQAANLLNASSLTPNEARAARLPEHAQVKEFYSRFR